MQQITHETIKNAFQIVKDGAGLVSKYTGTTWPDTQTRARANDITEGTALEVKNAAEMACNMLKYYDHGGKLRENEVKYMEFLKVYITAAQKNLEALSSESEGGPEA